MDNQPGFFHSQYNFAAHIRDPASNPRPAGIEDRRMKIYRELFYNNVEDFMSNSFPIMKQILGDEPWHAMIRDYFAQHRAHTPLFPEMPREFLKYLEQERTPQPDDHPFLWELAHYEWVELALSISEQENDLTKIDTQGDLLDSIPALSVLAWPLSYQYPVHQISPEYLPEQPGAQPTHILVYRDHQDQVNFMELNQTTVYLVQQIQTNRGHTGRQLLQDIADQMQHPDPQLVISGGQQILNDLRQRGIVIGTLA